MEQSLGIAIIGAGITGLTAADHLVKAGRDVEVFDKGRGIGGRIATRRTERGVFDYGAPELQVTSEAFRDFLASLGAVSENCGSTFGALGMRSIFDPLIARLDIRQGVEVAGLARERRGWVVQLTNGQSVAHFHTVLVTAPAPQAQALVASVAPKIAREIGAVTMHSLWTCLVEFDAVLPMPGSLAGRGQVLRADRMASKPARKDKREAWVIHMRPEFALEDSLADRGIVASLILESFGEAYGVSLPLTRYLDAHRWRYAFADQPLGHLFRGNAERDLLVGGDWTLGPRAEHGFESGLEMAKAVLSREVVNV